MTITSEIGISKILAFFFGKKKRQLILLVAGSFVAGLLDAATIAIVYPILDAAFEGGIGQAGFILSLFSYIAGWLPIADQLISYCVLFMILASLSFCFRLFFIRYRIGFSSQSVEKTQQEIYKKYVQADYDYFTEQKQGELVYNAISAPQGLQWLLNSATEILSQIILSLSIFVLLFSLSWQGTIVVLVLGLIYFLFTRYLSDKVAYDAGKRQAIAIKESVVILNETIEGIKHIKVYATVTGWVQRFFDALRVHWHNVVRQSVWQQSLHPGLYLLIYLAIGATAVSIRLIAPNSFGNMIAVFGTFAFSVFRLIPMLTAIANAVMQMKLALPNCEIVYRILSQNLINIQNGTTHLENLDSGIEFNNVTFTYPGRKNILEEVSLVFEKGQTTAIVGRSGSGKTTVINLLLRLYDVTSGDISINRVNIKEYDLSSWLSKIGYVGQDTFIFNDTIKNNITFGTDYPEEEIVRISQFAHAHDFIVELPHGYDTIVGDKGMKLSGGQRQRIAIARAMLRNPEIFIFDEATNALDTISESAVQRAIDEIARDHTVIVIAHRLSTIEKADKIIVLGSGHVVEQGSHHELIGSKGAYWKMHNTKPI